jgi:hypothetical protein
VSFTVISSWIYHTLKEGSMVKILHFIKKQIDYFFDELVLPEPTGKPLEKKVSLHDIVLCIIAI